MERVGPVAVIACLVLLVSAGIAPGAGFSADAQGDTASGMTAAPPVGGGDAARASLAHGTATASRPPRLTENSTARLTIPPFRVTQSEFEIVHLGMGSTLQSGRDGAVHANDRIAIEREFEVAGTTRAKKHVIDNALIDLENEAKALEHRERRTLRQYSDGNISGGTTVRRLARIDAEAREMLETVQLLRSLSNRIDVDVFEPRFPDVVGRLTHLRGPVRHRAADAMAGEASSTRIHVTASDEAIVMSMMVDGEYVREAKDWRNRDAEGERELTSSKEVLNRADELYPWVFSQRGETGTSPLGLGVWEIYGYHSQGELEAYVDTSTGDVFRETQRLRVDEMPVTSTVTNTSGDIRVILERTYVGGPVRIYVENAATSAALNARIEIGGHDLGNAGADGYMQTIEPRPPYTVTVTYGDRVFSFTVDRPVGESEG